MADPNALDLEITVNCELHQKSNTRHLIFEVKRPIKYASAMYTV